MGVGGGRAELEGARSERECVVCVERVARGHRRGGFFGGRCVACGEWGVAAFATVADSLGGFFAVEGAADQERGEGVVTVEDFLVVLVGVGVVGVGVGEVVGGFRGGTCWSFGADDQGAEVAGLDHVLGGFEDVDGGFEGVDLGAGECAGVDGFGVEHRSPFGSVARIEVYHKMDMRARKMYGIPIENRL